MSGFSRAFLPAVCLSLAGVCAVSAEPPLQLAPQKGALLLRSGQVLLGKITPAGDHYIVSLAPHGEIRPRTSDVDLLCKDLEEVYRVKRSRIELGKAADHVELADWCLRYNLFDHANTEIGYAIAADPNYPRIRLLERKLALARAVPEAQPSSRKTVEEGPTNEELDRFTRGLPPAAVEAFTSTVQPLLVNACTTSGCHCLQSEAKMQLLRITPGSAPTRRTTQRNLYAVYQQINASEPATSPLLLAPTRQHGGAKAAMFTDRQTAQYRELIGWVGQIALARKPAKPATVGPPSATLLQTMPADESPPHQPAGVGRLGGDEPHDGNAPKTDTGSADAAADSATPPSGDGGENPLSKKPVKRAVDNYTPLDPFDPEIFNRQYHSGE